MSKWVCRLCIVTKGLRGSELIDWPDTDDEEGQVRHIEEVHRIPVVRVRESQAEAEERLRRENPETGGSNCRCPACAGVV